MGRVQKINLDVSPWQFPGMTVQSISFLYYLPHLVFPKLSSQIEWCLCLKAMPIDLHWMWDAVAWAIKAMDSICQATSRNTALYWQTIKQTRWLYKHRFYYAYWGTMWFAHKGYFCYIHKDILCYIIQSDILRKGPESSHTAGAMQRASR